jgi:hypothetical protein
LNQHEAASLEAVKEANMPWYAWLILLVALGSIVGGLMMLRQSAQKLPLTEGQLKRVHERNAEMDAKESRDK